MRSFISFSFLFQVIQIDGNQLGGVKVALSKGGLNGKAGQIVQQKVSITSVKLDFSGDKQDNLFNAECLVLANSYRAKHHSPPLVSGKTDFAKSRCKLLTTKGYLDNGHEEVAPPKHSENIYRSSAEKMSVDCKRVIDKWYSEITNHNFENPTFRDDTAHFMQMVWKKSLRMGCAKCESKSDGTPMNTYVVCNYFRVATSRNSADIRANVLKA